VSRIPSLDGDLPGLIGGPDLTVWVAMLLIQSLPYAATVLVSLVNALDLPGTWIGEVGLAKAPVATPARTRLPFRLGRRSSEARVATETAADEDVLAEERA